MRVLAVALWCLAGADDIAVIDGLFSRDEVRVLAAAVDSLAYTFDEQDHDAAEPAGSVAELPLNGELVAALAARAEAALREHPPAAAFAKELELYRAYVNRFARGDAPGAHRDARLGSEHVTALVYANDAWQRDWGGETIFYTEDHEIRRAVRPRPGRMILFLGGLIHSARPPLPSHGGPRYTVALKFQRVCGDGSCSVGLGADPPAA